MARRERRRVILQLGETDAGAAARCRYELEIDAGREGQLALCVGELLGCRLQTPLCRPLLCKGEVATCLALHASLLAEPEDFELERAHDLLLLASADQRHGQPVFCG